MASPSLQLRPDAAADGGEHLVGRVEIVGLVDRPEIVDGDDQEGDRGPQPLGLGDRLAQHGQQMGAVEEAGELVVARQEGAALLALGPLVDDAHDAARPRRPARSRRHTSGRHPR